MCLVTGHQVLVGFISGESFIELCWKSEFVGFFIKYNDSFVSDWSRHYRLEQDVSECLVNVMSLRSNFI